MKRYLSYSSIFGRCRFERMSSTSSSWKPKRSASKAASSGPGWSTWIQVSPLAESSAMRGSSRSATSPEVPGVRPRLMRGSVGRAIGTERVVESHSEYVILPANPVFRLSESEPPVCGKSPVRDDFPQPKCAWQDSNLRPCAPEAHALSPELQARGALVYRA